MTAQAATQEIKVRIAPDQKDTITRAAQARNISVSQLIRDAAQAYADEILAEVQFDAVTIVPPASFDAIVAALDEPGRPNPHLVEAGRRLLELDLD